MHGLSIQSRIYRSRVFRVVAIILVLTLFACVGLIVWLAPGFVIREAAGFGSSAAVKLLLACNHNLVSSRDSYLQTPLHFAAAKGRKEVAALLLANGADVNAMTWLGTTPLAMAVPSGDKDMMELLLANHADINGRDKNGFRQSILYNAVLEHRMDVAKFLISHHADVNAPDYFGRTPLYVAAERGDEEMVALLLANHADINAKDNDGMTPLHRAVKYGKDENGMAGFLRNHGGQE